MRLWGLSLPRPLPVVRLVSRYLTNYVIGRSPILEPTRYNSRADLDNGGFPHPIVYRVLSSLSRGYPLLEGMFWPGLIPPTQKRW